MALLDRRMSGASFSEPLQIGQGLGRLVIGPDNDGELHFRLNDSVIALRWMKAGRR
jgi:hypothetical protein